jgi:hypothetical protein
LMSIHNFDGGSSLIDSSPFQGTDADLF